jgi:hypothetical protein
MRLSLHSATGMPSRRLSPAPQQASLLFPKPPAFANARVHFGSGTEPEIVALRNGTHADRQVVQRTHQALKKLLTSGHESDLIALADIMEWARTATELPGHQSIPILPSELIDPRSFRVLEKAGLIPPDHMVPNDIINTVLSAALGCYPNVGVIRPYAPAKSADGHPKEHPAVSVMKRLMRFRWPF